MLRDDEPPAAWLELLAEIEREIGRVGYWSGEARRLRDAMGIRRLGRRNGAQLIEALRRRGYESDTDPINYESELLIVRRIGATELAKAISELLPAIREADRLVPRDADWRDLVVATLAVRKQVRHDDR